MNLYSVHIDRDRLDGGPGDASPVSGKIDRLVYRYVAQNIEQVWERHREIIMEGHDTMIGIAEEAKGVEVLAPVSSEVQK